ncbi:MAG: hypothetical protein ACLP4V_27195 [Methylocella sp.]
MLRSNAKVEGCPEYTITTCGDITELLCEPLFGKSREIFQY